MESLSPIVLVLVSFPEAALVAILGLSLLGIKPTAGQVLLIGTIEAILGGLTRLLPFPFGFHTILQFVIFSAVIYFVITIPFKFSFLVALLGLSIYGIIEAVTVPVLFSVTGLSFAEVFENSWLRVAFFAPEALILVIFILLVQRFSTTLGRYRDLVVKPESDKHLITDPSLVLVGLFLAQGLLIAILLVSSYTIAGRDNAMLQGGFIGFSILYALVISVLAVVMVLSIKRMLTLIQNETKTRAELDSLRRVEELVNTIRAQRHDFTNHLQVAYGLLEVGAYDEAKDYIARNVSDIARTLNLVKTDNLGITALLFTKTGLAEAKNIDFHIKVGSTLDPLPVESRDINTILGNLIDNAFEAVVDLPNDKRNVEVLLERTPDSLALDVKNAGASVEYELLPDIFLPGNSTKGDGRGMGLYSVKKLVEGHKGTIDIVQDDGLITFTVRIPLRNQVGQRI